MDKIDIPLDKFIENTIDKRPSVIYNYKTIKTFVFQIKSSYGSVSTVRTEYNLTSFDEVKYDTETFLKKINIELRREKILKLKEKWKGYR